MGTSSIFSFYVCGNQARTKVLKYRMDNADFKIKVPGIEMIQASRTEKIFESGPKYLFVVLRISPFTETLRMTLCGLWLTEICGRPECFELVC